MHPKYATFQTLYLPDVRPGDYTPIRVLFVRFIESAEE